MSGLVNTNDTIEASIKKADILIEALPYIRKLNKKRIVIKYGGNAMVNEDLKKSVMDDITLLKYVGINPIVVHGGGPDITSALGVYNIESKFINGLRVTDEDTVNIAQMVLVGKTNKDIVAKLNHAGGKAIGLCGIDGGMIKAEKLEDANFDYGYVGEIVSVDPKPIMKVLEEDYIPVIATVGIDDDGQVYNINADTAAAEIAAALGAENIITLSDIATNDVLEIYYNPKAKKFQVYFTNIKFLSLPICFTSISGITTGSRSYSFTASA